MFSAFIPTALKAILKVSAFYDLLRHRPTYAPWTHAIAIMESLILVEGTFLQRRYMKICTLLHKQALHPHQPSTFRGAHALMALFHRQENML